MSKNYRIYLDVCCLNRPFDDQSQLRIRLESEAIMTIIYKCQQQQWKLITSSALDAEVSQIPNPKKLENVKKILSLARIKVLSSDFLETRTHELVQLGFSSYDAAHIASAEKSKADVFLTTDDRLLNRGQRLSTLINVNIDNPLQWLAKIIQEEDNDHEDTK